MFFSYSEVIMKMHKLSVGNQTSINRQIIWFWIYINVHLPQTYCRLYSYTHLFTNVWKFLKSYIIYNFILMLLKKLSLAMPSSDSRHQNITIKPGPTPKYTSWYQLTVYHFRLQSWKGWWKCNFIIDYIFYCQLSTQCSRASVFLAMKG